MAFRGMQLNEEQVTGGKYLVMKKDRSGKRAALNRITEM